MIVTTFPRAVRVIEHTTIPLQDGTRLAARIWLPEDAEQHPVPAILEYLPYRKRDGTYERDALTHPYLAGHGYAGVRVDIRGTGESDGLLSDEYAQQEQDDALEVIAWLAAQPWCSGAVGMIGISWGGFNALQVAARRPPALKAIVTICSTDDRYADDVHYMGGAKLNAGFGWACVLLRRHVPSARSRAGRRALAGDVAASGWRTLPLFLEHLARATSGATPTGGTARCARTTARSSARSTRSAAGPTATPTPSRACSQRLAVPRKGLIGPWAHAYPHFALPGPADRLPAGDAALVGPLAEGPRHRRHGRADAARLDDRQRAARDASRDAARPLGGRAVVAAAGARRRVACS